MPALPPPKARPKAGVCDVPQEAFAAPAVALAAKLGWDGAPGDVLPPPRQSGESDNDYARRVRFTSITVRDAQRFIAKTLHEHFSAGALGQPQPDSSAASLHLNVDTESESKALFDALAAAYESGKGQPTSQVEIKKVSADTQLDGRIEAVMAAKASK
jgi:hypothetical protein